MDWFLFCRAFTQLVVLSLIVAVVLRAPQFEWTIKDVIARISTFIIVATPLAIAGTFDELLCLSLISLLGLNQ